MIITSENLALAFKGFKAVYTDAFMTAPAHADKISMKVTSNSADETYGWLGAFPSMREWIGPRIIKNLMAQAVQTGVQAAFSAMQAGAQVAQMPMIAPIADAVMQGAGYQKPDPMGADPNFPTPEQAAARNIRSPYVEGEGAQVGSEQLPEMQVRQNTSPAFPPVPQQVPTGMQGIETPATGDNLPA